jgi:hypothetical protein
MPLSILIQNQNKDVPPIRGKYCNSFLCRLRGLTFRRELDRDEGLLLVEGHDSRIDTAIHMLFVWFDLAVIWINSDMLVVDKVLARRWHPAYVPKQPAKYILEIHPDRLDDFEIGHKVKWNDS